MGIQILKRDREYFQNIGQVQFEGVNSKAPFAFRWYDENRVVRGRPLKEWLRFACAYWHSFNGDGTNPFGAATHIFPWNESADVLTRAKAKMDAAFEFMTKLSFPFYCFHDVDLIDYGNDVAENDSRLYAITDYALEKQQQSGIQLLWGTANLFSHPRYMNGAATNPDFQVVTHAAAQVKAAFDATIKLGGRTMFFGEVERAICPC